MNQDTRSHDKLRFLLRVVGKEISHLDYAAEQAFSDGISIERMQTLEHDQALALIIEAFVSRFCRLQDTIGDKLLPAVLTALGEQPAALLINLDKAERYGWLESVEQWMLLRQIRNQMIHEYMEDVQKFTDAIQTAHASLNILKNMADKLKDVCQQHLLVTKSR